MTTAVRPVTRRGRAHTERGTRWDWVAWALIGTVVLGSLLRFGGITWGLPMQLHPDEWVIVEGAIDLATRNSFEPSQFSRPDHLEILLSYLLYMAWSYAAHGMPPEVLFDVSETPFYALSRAVTAAMGAAMIPLAFLIGRPFAREAGLFMAIGVAFFPPFVEHSRYATPDVPLTFTVMLVILGCVLYIRSQSWWSLFLACAGVALGITVKYPAIIGCLAIAASVGIASILARRPWRILGRGAAAVGMVIGVTFAVSPVLFTNASEVLHQISAQNAAGHLGASGLTFGEKLALYANLQVEFGGVLMVLFALAAVIWVGVRRRWDAAPLGIGLIYWIAISSLSLHWVRWGLPMWISVVLLGGLGVWVAWQWASRARREVIARSAVATAASVSGVTLLVSSLVVVASALAPDTRTVAARDLEARGLSPANTSFDGYTPFLPGGVTTVADELTLVDDTVVRRPAYPALEFALLSERMSERYLADPNRPEHALYTAIESTLPVIKEWVPAESPLVEEWMPVQRSTIGVWEPVRLVQSVAYLATLAQGGMSGYVLTLYELPPAS